MKAKPKPVKRIIATIPKNSLRFRILCRIPVAISPFRILNARVGSNVLNYVDIVWRF
jgi:hypothetical protein